MIKVEVTKSEWVHKYGNYTILLKQAEGEGYYPVFVDELEAKLVRALNNQKSLLPYKATRLLPLLLEKAKVEMIRSEIFKNFFGDVFAKVVFRNQKKTKKLTCDLGVAIELALRCNVPIFIEKSLLLDPESADQNPRHLLNELESLKKDLQQAVELEKYEEAARIRDKIFKIEKNRENKIHS
ncbi:bifunctional nuclease family protein [candidate division KSB1 bacterium]|nr:bifunctional nuclease family protein [candidate division KSB1 bacterium]